jgi:hypothetical protein
MKQISIIWLALCIISPIHGQEASGEEQFRFTIGFKKQLGFIADVSLDYQHLIHSHVYPYHLDIAYQTRGKKPWHHLYNYPEHGLSLWYINLQNPNQLGSLIVAMPYINFRIYERGRFSFKLRPSVGIAYATKTYHRTENHKNLFYSSHLNAAFGFLGEFNYQINEQVSVNINPLFNHFSNGEINKPNYGMNVPGISFGVKYVSNPNPPKINPVLEIPEKRKLNFSVSPSFGVKETRPFEGPKYYIYTLTSDVLYKITRWQYIGGGFDIIYDEENVRKWLGEDAYRKKDLSNNLRALHLTHELIVYPLHIVAQMGMYTNNAVLEPKQKFFNRFGIKYFFLPSVFVGITHKSHFFFIGDYIDWAVGIRI